MMTRRPRRTNKRRRQVFLKKLAVAFSVITIAAGFGIAMGNNLAGSNQVSEVSAQDKDIRTEHKYYKSVKVVSGDTLWDLAQVYMDDDYDCVQDYIDEVKAINGLSEDDIHEGKYLTVPYYDYEVM